LSPLPLRVHSESLTLFIAFCLARFCEITNVELLQKRTRHHQAEAEKFRVVHEIMEHIVFGDLVEIDLGKHRIDAVGDLFFRGSRRFVVNVIFFIHIFSFCRLSSIASASLNDRSATRRESAWENLSLARYPCKAEPANQSRMDIPLLLLTGGFVPPAKGKAGWFTGRAIAQKCRMSLHCQMPLCLRMASRCCSKYSST